MELYNYCKKIEYEISKARLKYETDLVKKATKNPKILYNYMNNQRSIKDSIKAIKRSDGLITHDSQEIVNILNKNFQIVFVRENDCPLPTFEKRTNELFDMSSDDITYEDVSLRLTNLEENKSCGVDNLHAVILKNCSLAFAIPLTLIYKESFEQSLLPMQFKSAKETKHCLKIIDQYR